MPELGDKCRGDAIGKSPKTWYFWVECPECQKQRWVTVNSHRYIAASVREGKYRRCRDCHYLSKPKWVIGPKILPWKGYN